jgi:lysophospholipase L1-like esterase
LAAGYQPSDGSSSPPVDPKTGFSDQGYPGGYASDLASERHLTLVDLACPGETTASMVGTPARPGCAGDYRAEFRASSQLTAALAFLAGHKHQVQLVSLDLGANDIESCAATGSPNAACLAKGAATTARELPTILNKLKSALEIDDPGAPLVGMNYYDPFLGLEYRPGGPKPSAAAVLSLVLLDGYNQELTVLYRRAHVPVADVASAFESGRTVPLTTYGTKLLPRDAALVCRWTWMCPISPAKDTADIYANTAGYSVIAGAFESALGKS